MRAQIEKRIWMILCIGLFFGVLALDGCGKGVQFSIDGNTLTFKQTPGISNGQIDVLWVIDNSGSMAPFQTNLTSNFNSFISNMNTKGYDFRLAVTTSDAYMAVLLNDPTLAQFRDGVG